MTAPLFPEKQLAALVCVRAHNHSAEQRYPLLTNVELITVMVQLDTPDHVSHICNLQFFMPNMQMGRCVPCLILDDDFWKTLVISLSLGKSMLHGYTIVSRSLSQQKQVISSKCFTTTKMLYYYHQKQVISSNITILQPHDSQNDYSGEIEGPQRRGETWRDRLRPSACRKALKSRNAFQPRWTSTFPHVSTGLFTRSPR